MFLSNIVKIFYLRPFLIGLIIFFTTAPIYFVPIGFVVISYFLHFNFYYYDLKLKLKYAFSFGLGFFFANFYWMSFSMLVDFTSYWLYFFPSLVIIPAYFTFFYLLPQVYLLHYLNRTFHLKKFSFYLFAVALWFTFEVVRSSTLVLIDLQGFSWGLLGYNFFVSDYLAQIYSLVGVYGASFIITALYGLLFLIVNQDFSLISKRALGYFVSGNIVVFSLIFYYGNFRINILSESDKKFSYLIVHPAISEHHNFVYERALANLDGEIRLAANQSGFYDFVIFPEGGISFPVDVSEESEVFAYILDQLDNARYLIAGASRIADEGQFNSFFIYDQFAKIVDYYDKRYLVPFGEYIPYLRIFNNPLVSKSAGYSSGELKAIKVNDSLPIIKPLICYDALYSKSTLHDSADVIINISNDIWFIQKIAGMQISTAPFQHLDIVRSRAIEVATPVLRSTNLGISAVIDARGRIVKKAEPYIPSVIAGELSLTNSEKTVYEQIAELF